MEDLSDEERRNSSRFKPGSHAGKYVIEEVLGVGGSGTVYRAKDPLLDKSIALKVLTPDLRDEKSLIRFQREAKTASQLRHPRIATIMDFGLLEESVLFMAMELADGRSLSSILEDRHTLSIQETLTIATLICDALAYSHTKGIVHRDIKPSNVIINNSKDGKIDLMVVDFGIAKRMTISDSEAHSITTTGDILGTPLYMSPEQSMGVECGPQADMYSLGCLIFHCLSGQPPFSGGSAIETIRQHQQEPAPDVRTVAKQALPDAIVLLLERLLAKNPAERFSSIEQLIAHLSEIEEEVSTVPEESESTSQKESLTPNLPATESTKRGSRPVLKIVLPVLGTIALIALVLQIAQLSTQLAKMPEPEVGFAYTLSSKRKTHNHSEKDPNKQADEVVLSKGFIERHVITKHSDPINKLINGRRSRLESASSIIETAIRKNSSSIDLHGHTDLKAGLLKPLSKCTIEYLDLSNTNVTDKLLEELKGAQIKRLSLEGDKISKLEFANHIGALLSLNLSKTKSDGSTLRKLNNPDLRDIVLPSIEVEHIEGMLRRMINLANVRVDKKLSNDEAKRLSMRFPFTSFENRSNGYSQLLQASADIGRTDGLEAAYKKRLDVCKYVESCYKSRLPDAMAGPLIKLSNLASDTGRASIALERRKQSFAIANRSKDLNFHSFVHYIRAIEYMEKKQNSDMDRELEEFLSQKRLAARAS
ncbi:MAG: serine/threonine protein kinase, partial [Cyanobacteria bacterium]|nr:serine/threonine protein kinase [Cyanobacteriota bacterium]